MAMQKKNLLSVTSLAFAVSLSLTGLLLGPGSATACVYDLMTVPAQKPSVKRPFPEGKRAEATR
jgi:hypothetical protein